MPREEIQRLCDVHLAVFRESLEQDTTLAPAGHPVHILVEEHKSLLGFADDLGNLADELRDREDIVGEEMEDKTDESVSQNIYNAYFNSNYVTTRINGGGHSSVYLNTIDGNIYIRKGE